MRAQSYHHREMTCILAILSYIMALLTKNESFLTAAAEESIAHNLYGYFFFGKKRFEREDNQVGEREREREKVWEREKRGGREDSYSKLRTPNELTELFTFFS